MEVAYFEMQGAGNKIVVVDQREQNLPPPDASRLRELAQRDGGSFFDQMMWVSPAENPACVASYRIFNADGSEVEQCGNGVRCVARIVARNSRHASRFSLGSPSGPVDVRIEGDLIAVSMGVPEFEPDRIPFIADRAATHYTLEAGGEQHQVQAVSMGNPHCVLQVDSVKEAAVSQLGPEIESHRRFPERTNVGFMQIVDRQHIELRVHERGVGETLACGTGACAAVVCGRQTGLLDETVTVSLPGGQLVVSWCGDREPVWLTGNAELISEGTLQI